MRTEHASGMNRGMTLIEIMVAASVFSIAMFIAMQATLIMNKSAADGIQYSALNRIAATAFARMSEELGKVRATDLVNDTACLSDTYKMTPSGQAPYYTAVFFKQVTGYDPGSSSVTTTPSYCAFKWVVAERGDPQFRSAVKEDTNNYDNNANGVTDEGCIMWDDGGTGQTDIMLIDRVPEGGLQIRRQGDGLDITLRLYYIITENGMPTAKYATFNTTVTLTN